MHLWVTNWLQGDEERELLKEENVVNATLTEYLEEAKLVRRSVIKVGKKQKGRMQTAKWMKVVDRVYQKHIDSRFLFLDFDLYDLSPKNWNL